MRNSRLLGCAIGAMMLAACAVPRSTATVAPTAAAATPTPVVEAAAPILAGQLRYAGQGLSGGEARLYPAGWRESGSEPEAVAKADLSGSFAFDAAPEGEWVLVGAFDDGLLDAGGWLPVTINDGEVVAKVLIELQRPLEVAEPTPGATVSNTPTLRWVGVSDATHFKLQVIDAGTTEMVFDLEAELPAEQEQTIVLPPLTPGHAYEWNVALLDALGAELAYGGGSFTVEGNALDVAVESSPLDGLPPSCLDGSGTRASYADAAGHYCFLYPVEFAVGSDEAGNPLLTGPALDARIEPMRATLSITVDAAPQGQSLEEIAANLIASSAAPGLAMEAMPMSLSGVPAMQVAPVPGQPTALMVLTVVDGRLYQLRFAPAPSEWPDAADEVEELFATVTGSLTFLQ